VLASQPAEARKTSGPPRAGISGEVVAVVYVWFTAELLRAPRRGAGGFTQWAGARYQRLVVRRALKALAGGPRGRVGGRAGRRAGRRGRGRDGGRTGGRNGWLTAQSFAGHQV